MATIHLAGSIALFLFGGLLLIFGLFAILLCWSFNSWVDGSCGGYVNGVAYFVGGIGMIIGGVVLAMRSSKQGG